MRPFSGYPTSWGNKRASVFPHRGPSSYTQITPGAAPALATGGDTCTPAEAGMNYFEFLAGGLTDSGTFRVECIPTTVTGVIGNNNPGVTQPGTSYRLRWVVVATGAEVAAAFDLDAEIVRLLAVGPS